MIRRLLAVIAGVLLLAGRAEAALPEAARRAVQRIVVQDHGRLKPFDSFAREVLERITGKPAVPGAHPVDTVVEILASPEAWQAKPLIQVPFVPLREALGMGRRDTHASYSDLVASRKLMRLLPAIVRKQQQDEKLVMQEQETMDAFDRFVTFNQLTEHKLALIPATAPGTLEWSSIAEQRGEVRQAWDGFLAAVRAGRPEEMAPAAERLGGELRRVNPAAYPAQWRVELEIAYHRAAPFRAAEWCYVLAMGCLAWGLFRDRTRVRSAGLAALAVAAVLHASGILLRVVLGGRPPVSNFYETMLWLPFVAVVLALVFERIYRSGYFGLASALVAALTLRLSEHVPLDPSITPVVAVLRSNLWLTVHVLTIVASYGALALATALAHVYGVLYLTPRPNKRTLASMDLFLYRAIQVGVVLLAGGVMLGAVWANASWGRYWGWDPKETWALITLLWFLAVLHGRFAGWLRGVGVVLSTLGGFLLLLMTYYGVSFYLVGLHSYAGGSAKPIPAILVGYLILEAAFSLAVGFAALRRRKPARA